MAIVVAAIAGGAPTPAVALALGPAPCRMIDTEVMIAAAGTTMRPR